MELSEFIKKAPSIIENDETSVVLIQGTVYPHLFFTQFFDSLKSQVSCDIKMIDIQTNDFNFKSQLSTSFLGMSCVYWLADASSLKLQQKDDVIKYLMNYQGPHTVIAFFDTKTSLEQQKHISLVTIKDKYFFDDAKLLWSTYDFEQSKKIVFFLHQIYKFKNSYVLDELFLLKNYQDLLGADSNSKTFYQSWIARLVETDTSLFTLSQLFFEKKEKDFLSLWLQIKPLYSDMFWVSYWSDQVYRAYFFIRFTNAENYAAAKQCSFGLPFSFLKQTYKIYQLHELQGFHQAMYTIDIALKNGGNSYEIDQLYIKFFGNKFK